MQTLKAMIGFIAATGTVMVIGKWLLYRCFLSITTKQEREMMKEYDEETGDFTIEDLIN